MSNTPERRSRRLTGATLLDTRPPRCECGHPYELDGRCTSDAAVRVSVLCAVVGCERAVRVLLACEPCLESWREAAKRDQVRLRIQRFSRL